MAQPKFKKNSTMYHKLMIVFIYVFCVHCSFKESGTSDVVPEILRGFERDNNGVLSSFDSCFFVNNIKSTFHQSENDLVRIINGVEIKSYTNSAISFSFSLVKKLDAEKWTFFGGFEHYMLSHLSVKDSARLISIDNQRLTFILEQLFIVDPAAGEEDVAMSLKSFLYQLYFRNVQGLHQPVFQTEEKSVNLSAYLTNDQRILLDQSSSKNIIVFKDELFGLLIFKWRLSGRNVVVDSFIFPFGKYSWVGASDVSFDFSKECNALD